MMRRLRRHILLIATASLVACGGPAASVITRSAPAPGTGYHGDTAVVAAHLWLREGTYLAMDLRLVDSASAKTISAYPDGVAARDWSRLYVVMPLGARTVIKAVDPATARTVSITDTRRGYALPRFGAADRPAGLSPDGRHLVLATPPSDPGAHATSSFLVYDTQRLGASPIVVTLAGRFSFDGISDDGHGLYLLQTQGDAATSDTYSVRRFDLVAMRLDAGSIVDKRSNEQTISGTGIDSVTSPDGAWQYTLYAFGSMPPFVHALNLADAAAFCVDLPKPADDELELLWGLAASRDGHEVYAVNGGTGALTVMSGSRPWQTRTATLPVPAPATTQAWVPWAPGAVEAKRLVYGAAVISPDGRTLYSAADHGVLVVDTESLHLVNTLVPTQPLTSLIISDDGARLYATTMDSVTPLLQVDAHSGRWAAIGNLGRPVSVLRVMR